MRSGKTIVPCVQRQRTKNIWQIALMTTTLSVFYWLPMWMRLFYQQGHFCESLERSELIQELVSSRSKWQPHIVIMLTPGKPGLSWAFLCKESPMVWQRSDVLLSPCRPGYRLWKPILTLGKICASMAPRLQVHLVPMEVSCKSICEGSRYQDTGVKLAGPWDSWRGIDTWIAGNKNMNIRWAINLTFPMFPSAAIHLKIHREDSK